VQFWLVVVGNNLTPCNNIMTVRPIVALAAILRLFSLAFHAQVGLNISLLNVHTECCTVQKTAGHSKRSTQNPVIEI